MWDPVPETGATMASRNVKIDTKTTRSEALNPRCVGPIKPKLGLNRKNNLNYFSGLSEWLHHVVKSRIGRGREIRFRLLFSICANG